MMGAEKASRPQPPHARRGKRRGVVRRALDWLDRIDQALLRFDNGPYDHLADRIANLETRIAKLESRVSPDV